MKVYAILTQDKHNELDIPRISYSKKVVEDYAKLLKNSGKFNLVQIFEKSIKRTNDMIVKDFDDKIEFHNSLIRRNK